MRGVVVGVVASLALAAACAPDAEPEGCLLEGAGPADELLFVANSEEGTLSVVDPRACAVVATIDVGGEPGELNTTPDGSLVFATVREAEGNGRVAVIDTDTLEKVAEVEVGARPTHNSLAPDGATLWVGNDDAASVTAVDVASFEVLDTVGVGNGHRKIAFSDGDPYLVFTSDIADGTISIVDSAERELVATVPVGTGPHGMAFSPLNQRLYNCTGSPNGLDVIATEGDDAFTAVKKVPLEERCGYITTAPDERHLWATASGPDPESIPGSVFVLDAGSDEVVATVAAGLRPDKVEFLPARGLAVVSNVGSPEVTVIDMETYETVQTPEVGAGEAHRQIKVSRDGRHAYVPNAVAGTVHILDLETGAVRGEVEVGVAPTGIIVAGPGGGLPYPH